MNCDDQHENNFLDSNGCYFSFFLVFILYDSHCKATNHKSIMDLDMCFDGVALL